MLSQIFRSRWGALIIVMICAAGAAALIGTGENSGMLLDAADRLASQQSELGQPAAAVTDPISVPDTHDPSSLTEFTPDDELVDDTSGIDPTPPEEQPFQPDVVAQSDDMVIVLDDDPTGQ